MPTDSPSGGESAEPTSLERACHEAFSRLKTELNARGVEAASLTLQGAHIDVSDYSDRIFITIARAEGRSTGFQVADFVEDITDSHWSDRITVDLKDRSGVATFDDFEGSGFLTRPLAESAMDYVTALAVTAIRRQQRAAHVPSTPKNGGLNGEVVGTAALDLFERAYSDIRDWLDEAKYEPRVELVPEFGQCKVYEIKYLHDRLAFFDVVEPLEPDSPNRPILRAETIPAATTKNQAFQAKWRLTVHADQRMDGEIWPIASDATSRNEDPKKLAETLDKLVEDYLEGGWAGEQLQFPD